MALSIGIVGLPNVGKSTLFNALTKKSVPAENFPFCTIDPSIGVVAVPDTRLEKLSALSRSQKTIPAAVEFVDIAGLVKGAAEGEGLGNQFLSHIRECDAIAEVVRIFDSPTVHHVHGDIDPSRDIEVVNLELAMADVATVEKRLSSVERDARSGKKEATIEQTLLVTYRALLAAGKPARLHTPTEAEAPCARGLHLLTNKPILYVLNKKAGAYNLDEHPDDPRWHALMTLLSSEHATYVIVDAGIEHELKELEGEEKDVFRKELGGTDDGINALIVSGYRMLGLSTYFTTGEKETRAWTFKNESTAPEAAAAIHTDFREKFIRAEVIQTDKLLEAGSYAVARENGWVRTEGKEYLVKDGDVMEFKI